jgi:ElaB/YqjD/DUF883 family membrane-anchored ribosome-binding protein
MKHSSWIRILAAGGAVLVLATTAVTVVAAQAQPTPTQTQRQNARQKYEEALANRLHVTVDQLRQAIQGARQDVGLPEPAARPGNGPGPGIVRGFGFPGRGFAFGAFLNKEADAVAALFGESTDDLKQELPGKTLAELAASHGKSTQDVVNTIVKTANDQLDQVAQTRNIPADRVSQIKQQISERTQQFVTTHRFPARGSGLRS